MSSYVCRNKYNTKTFQFISFILTIDAKRLVIEVKRLKFDAKRLVVEAKRLDFHSKRLAVQTKNLVLQPFYMNDEDKRLLEEFFILFKGVYKKTITYHQHQSEKWIVDL